MINNVCGSADNVTVNQKSQKWQLTGMTILL